MERIKRNVTVSDGHCYTKDEKRFTAENALFLARENRSANFNRIIGEASSFSISLHYSVHCNNVYNMHGRGIIEEADERIFPPVFTFCGKTQDYKEKCGL